MRSTFLEYMLAPGKVVPPVTMVYGENALLVRVAVEDVLDRAGHIKDVRGGVQADAITRFFGDTHSARTVLMALAKNPLFEGRQEAVVYDQIEKVEGGIGLLSKFVDSPTHDIFLILVSYENQRRGEWKWLPANDSIQLIDCSKVDIDKMVSYAKLQGLVEAEAEWLVQECGGDAQEVFRHLDMLQVFPIDKATGKYDPGLVEHIFGRLGKDTIRFDKYVILDNGSDIGLCVRLRKRIEQLLILSTHAGHHLTALELMNRADIEGWLLKRVLGLAKSQPPKAWLDRLVIVAEAEAYARVGQKGVREYLAALL